MDSLTPQPSELRSRPLQVFSLPHGSERPPDAYRQADAHSMSAACPDCSQLRIELLHRSGRPSPSTGTRRPTRLVLTYQLHPPWPGRGEFLLPPHVRLAPHTQVFPVCSCLCVSPFSLGLQPEALLKSLEKSVSTKKGSGTDSKRNTSLIPRVQLGNEN